MQYDSVGPFYDTGKYMIDDSKSYDEICKGLNDRFKTITTWTEFKDLVDEVNNSWDGGLWFRMTTKKGGNLNGIWGLDDLDRVIYITDQTSIEYNCKIKNLHKVMRIG